MMNANPKETNPKNTANQSMSKIPIDNSSQTATQVTNYLRLFIKNELWLNCNLSQKYKETKQMKKRKNAYAVVRISQ